MTAPRAYLDHNATTPLHPAAKAAMAAAFEVSGNPSSVHAEGRAARALIDDARRRVSAFVGTTPEDIVFASCGTEALNIALSPEVTLDGHACHHLLVGGGEHPAVTSGHRFGDRVTIVPLTSDGRLNLDALRETLIWFAGRRPMLALQAANNETGVIQPVCEAAEIIHAAGGFVVCDAVQAAGKIECNINDFSADVLAISAHKFGGPKGIGALCFAPSRHHLRRGVVRGGGQERGLSAGTENVIGIVGLGAACSEGVTWPATRTAQLRTWRDAIEEVVARHCPGAVIFGQGVERLPNTVAFAVSDIDAQVLMMSLDLGGVAVSSGSACASGKVKASGVLKAMGVDDARAASALRVSLGWTTTANDIALFESALTKALRTMRPRAAA